MTTMLEQALVAYTRPPEVDRQVRVEDAIALNEWGVFSIHHIIQLTGLPETFTYDLLKKTDRTGGRFNAAMMPLIYDLWLEFARGQRNQALARQIIKGGVSPLFLSKLTGIPATTLKRWARG